MPGSSKIWARYYPMPDDEKAINIIADFNNAYLMAKAIKYPEPLLYALSAINDIYESISDTRYQTQGGKNGI